MICIMADGISFGLFLSLNCTDLYKREEILDLRLGNQTLEVRVRTVRSTSLIIHRKWLLHHQKVTRCSFNLNIGMEHMHNVKTQVRLLHLIRVCTISYSSVLNKYKRKCSDDSIRNIGPKHLSIHCVSRSYCSI